MKKCFVDFAVLDKKRRTTACLLSYERAPLVIYTTSTWSMLACFENKSDSKTIVESTADDISD